MKRSFEKTVFEAFDNVNKLGDKHIKAFDIN
jgi:hypothetical protein